MSTLYSSQDGQTAMDTSDNPPVHTLHFTLGLLAIAVCVTTALFVLRFLLTSW
jgi:hypothetical protein